MGTQVNVDVGGAFWSFLQIALICMKLAGKLDWDWVWVLSITWVPLAAVIIFGLLAGAIIAIIAAVSK